MKQHSSLTLPLGVTNYSSFLIALFLFLTSAPAMPFPVSLGGSIIPVVCILSQFIAIYCMTFTGALHCSVHFYKSAAKVISLPPPFFLNVANGKKKKEADTANGL